MGKFQQDSSHEEKAIFHFWKDLLIVSPDLLLDPVEVGVLLSLAGDSLDQRKQVAGHREEGELETPARQVGTWEGGSSWQ